ncbi:hypothetical protein DRN72_03395, partial [Methanosarcinales archaeon]
EIRTRLLASTGPKDNHYPIPATSIYTVCISIFNLCFVRVFVIFFWHTQKYFKTKKIQNSISYEKVE